MKRIVFVALCAMLLSFISISNSIQAQPRGGHYQKHHNQCGMHQSNRCGGGYGKNSRMVRKMMIKRMMRQRMMRRHHSHGGWGR